MFIMLIFVCLFFFALIMISDLTATNKMQEEIINDWIDDYINLAAELRKIEKVLIAVNQSAKKNEVEFMLDSLEFKFQNPEVFDGGFGRKLEQKRSIR